MMTRADSASALRMSLDYRPASGYREPSALCGPRPRRADS